MVAVTILELREKAHQRWEYSKNYTDGAPRLVRISTLLSKQDPTIVLDEFRDLQHESPPHIPPYAAISHVWAQSPSVQHESQRHNRPLAISIAGETDTDTGRTHTISWHGLIQAARAAKHLKCEFLWLDFLCLHQTSKADKKLQIKNMGAIYQNATAVLVMPGGVSAAQKAEKSAGWIDRAWTLQESTLCANTYVLLDWPRKHSLTIGGITNAEFKYIGHGIAVIQLLGLLEARVTTEDIYYEIDGEEIEGMEIEIECFGKDMKAMMALWTMLEAKGDPYILKSAAWRSMWMRTSTKPQDLVFSVLHIFDADIQIDYSRSVDDLQLELAAKTADFPAWIYIGHDMPMNPKSQLLPALPTFVPNSSPVYNLGGNHIPVSSLVASFDYISAFDIKITSLPSFTGHSICAQMLSVLGTEDGEPGPSDRQFLDTYFPGDDDSQPDTTPVIPTLLHLAGVNGEVKVEAHISGEVGTHMLVLGETSPYRFLEFQELGALSFGGPSVVFLRQSSSSLAGENGSMWENCGCARLSKKLSETGRKHVLVGISPGRQIEECTCTERTREADLKPLEAIEIDKREGEFGYLFPGSGNEVEYEGMWEDEDEFRDSEGDWDGDPDFD